MLQLQLAPELPLVRIDNAMFEQLMANLGLNARDAMPHGGELRISTAAVELDEAYAHAHAEARPGTFICLTVTDTGCGMDQATLNRIFEPFFTTKQMGHGAGLGLATVYAIVKQHQGWIEVSSQPERGTLFKIYLPAELKGVEPGFEKMAPSCPAEGRERILIVEDEASLITLVRGILERYGYQVLSAATGQDALKLWEEHQGRFDLLLTDLVMPGGMSGAQLAEQLKAKQPALKVIYTSGYSADLMSDDIGELVEGVNFLQKPYRPHLLAQTVRHCLDGSARPPVTIIPAAMGVGD
jgi:CheY-like chemotaxis protein